MILDKAKTGSAIDGIELIDCHGHLGSWNGMHIPRGGIEDIIETMDMLGIDKLCLSHSLSLLCDFGRGNDILGQTIEKYPDRLIGYAAINPNYPDDIISELQRCSDRYGMNSAKIHPAWHSYPVNGKGYADFWKYADENQMVVLTHTYQEDENCCPGLFAKIAAEFRGVKIIMAHAGLTLKGCAESIEVIRKNDNVYVDTASSRCHFGMIERFVERIGAEHVLFGSDIPMLEPAAQIGRIAYSKIKDEDKEKIFGLNMKRLLA